MGDARALDTSGALESQTQEELKNQVLSLSEADARQFVSKCFNGDVSECEELFRQVSLLDPISLCRISLPVRSKNCTHIQCFDLRTHLINNFLGEKSYLKLSLEKSPKAIAVAKRLWRCPICSVMASRGVLLIDPFTKRIIAETSVDTARVLIYPNGKYTVCTEPIEEVASSDDDEPNKKDGSKPAPEDEIDLTLSDDEAVAFPRPLAAASSAASKPSASFCVSKPYVGVSKSSSVLPAVSSTISNSSLPPASTSRFSLNLPASSSSVPTLHAPSVRSGASISQSSTTSVLTPSQTGAASQSTVTLPFVERIPVSVRSVLPVSTETAPARMLPQLQDKAAVQMGSTSSLSHAEDGKEVTRSVSNLVPASFIAVPSIAPSTVSVVSLAGAFTTSSTVGSTITFTMSSTTVSAVSSTTASTVPSSGSTTVSTVYSSVATTTFTAPISAVTSPAAASSVAISTTATSSAATPSATLTGVPTVRSEEVSDPLSPRMLTAAEAFIVISSLEVHDVDTAAWLAARENSFESGFMFRRDSASHSPLTAAAAMGKVETMRLLIKQGADPKVRQPNGHDALTAALFGGHFEACDYLTTQSLMNMELGYVKSLEERYSVTKLDGYVQYRKARARNPLTPSTVAASSSNAPFPEHILEQLRAVRSRPAVLGEEFVAPVVSENNAILPASGQTANDGMGSSPSLDPLTMNSEVPIDGKPYKCSDGSTYEGAWRDGQMNGKGKRTWAENNYYDGQWVEGKMHGYGKRVWASKAVYEGFWKAGEFYGQGRLTRPSGYVHDGEWVDGHRNGRGQMIYSNGDVVSGIWRDDKLEEAFCAQCGVPMSEVRWRAHKCKGKPLCKSREKRWDLERVGFHPNYIDVVRECQEHKVSEVGSMKELLTRLKAHFMWHDAFENTSGKRSRSHWSKSPGRGRRGKSADTSDKRRNKDKTRSKTPERKDDRPFSGISKYTFVDGSVYVGFWRQRQRHGQGKLTLASGDVYEGLWKDDRPHGRGKYSWVDGAVFEIDTKES